MVCRWRISGGSLRQQFPWRRFPFPFTSIPKPPQEILLPTFPKLLLCHLDELQDSLKQQPRLQSIEQLYRTDLSLCACTLEHTQVGDEKRALLTLPLPLPYLRAIHPELDLLKRQ